MKWMILPMFLALSVTAVAQARFPDAQKVGRADNSPTIRGFAFEPVNSASGVYRFAWDVSGAQEGTMFLSADCLSGTIIESRAPGSTIATPFACGVLHSLPGGRGSMDLVFENSAGETVVESVRLFVAGSASVASTLSVPLTASK